VSVRWEKTRIQLVTDGVWARSQEEPGQQHQGEEGPRPHTLFVGGLPASGFSPKLPVAINSSGFSDILGATLPDVGLELEVRPQTATGLIFHLGRAQAPPYLQLQVLEKQVLLRADDGAGEFSTLVTHPKALCDGQWHRLAGRLCPAVTKVGRALRLEVDLQGNRTLGPTPGASADTLVPLHLGGLPESRATQAGLPTWTHPQPPVYLGCMRNLEVNRSPVALPRSARVQGAVGASGCPAT
ncbi:hypothetical protein CB1_072740001, partial [Camelus ferus]